MSQENIQVVREGIRRFCEGDMEGLGAQYHEDAVVTAPEGWPEGGDVHGRDAIVAQYRRLSEDWMEHTLSVESIEAEGDWVVARLHWSVQGASSGVPMQMDFSAAYRIDGGRIARALFMWDHDDAIRATGIPAS
jgi:ketosteroid isomerase-like protein